MFFKLRGKFPKLKKKTQNSRKKLKLREDFTPPERPSGVIKRPVKQDSHLKNKDKDLFFTECKKNPETGRCSKFSVFHHKASSKKPCNATVFCPKSGHKLNFILLTFHNQGSV